MAGTTVQMPPLRLDRTAPVVIASPLRTSLDRLIAFADAGADCLYAPGVTDLDEVEQIVKAVSPKPVNVVVSTNNCTLTVAQLAARRFYVARSTDLLQEPPLYALVPFVTKYRRHAGV